MPTKEELDSLPCSGEGQRCPVCRSKIAVMEKLSPLNHPRAGWIRTALYRCEQEHWLTEFVDLQAPIARLVTTDMRPKNSPSVR